MSGRAVFHGPAPHLIAHRFFQGGAQCIERRPAQGIPFRLAQRATRFRPVRLGVRHTGGRGFVQAKTAFQRVEQGSALVGRGHALGCVDFRGAGDGLRHHAVRLGRVRGGGRDVDQAHIRIVQQAAGGIPSTGHPGQFKRLGVAHHEVGRNVLGHHGRVVLTLSRSFPCG